MTVPMKSGVCVTADSVRREERMRVVLEAMNAVVSPVQKRVLKEFLVKSKRLVEFRCLSLLTSYCCGISDTRYMFAV